MWNHTFQNGVESYAVGASLLVIFDHFGIHLAHFFIKWFLVKNVQMSKIPHLFLSFEDPVLKCDIIAQHISTYEGVQ